MKKLLFTLILVCITGSITTSAQLLLMPGDYADPSILKDGEDYYMTHSPFHYQPGFLIWHSKDLLNWEPICRAGTDWEGSAWAPDLQKVGDTYYIYFPAAETNWVITAKDIRGPWTKPIDLKIGGIDPGLLVTTEGKRYLFTNAGQVTPLTADGLARAGVTETVYNGWLYPREWATECMCLESPKITYHNGYYYMTSAQGGTAGPATSHMAVCARSKSIYGPWENSPYNPIIHTYSADDYWWSKGHGTLVEGPDGQWWIVYHAYAKGAYCLGRQTLIEPIEWTKGGWYRTIKDMPLPTAGAMPDLSDNFSDNIIGWQWSGWKENAHGKVIEKDGILTIPGRGSSPKDGRLLLITATDTTYTIEANITIGNKGAEGGMLLFYDENAYAGISTNGKTFTIYRSAKETEQINNTLGSSFKLSMTNRNGQLSIKVCGKDKKWLVINDNIDVSEFHHNRFGGFIALRPALLATGNGLVKFRNFIYRTD